VIGYGGGDNAPVFMQRVNTTLAQIPGEQSVTGGFPIPFTYDSTDSFAIQGQPIDLSDPPVAKIATIQPGYFETLKVPLLQGRTFEERDNERAKRVAIVDAAFARQFFPNDQPIGKFIRPNVEDSQKSTWYEIVGVVGSMRTTDLTAIPEPQFFLPILQTNDTPQILILRTAGDPKHFEKSVTAAIQALNADTTIFDVSTMDERVTRSVVSARFEAQLLTAFGGMALLLAAVGLYAALSEMVARRTFEIGLRMALGAQTGDVFRLVLRRGLILAVVGMGIGLLGLAMVGRVFSDLLYEVKAFDPWTIFAVSAILILVSLVASVVPAWRAAGLEPTEALREQ
jgi:putative ABC transport system permease protein